MATTAKTSEAQRIVDDLVDRFGMAGAAIAREIGVKADTIQNIKGRRATGNLQLHRLRMLRDQMMSAADAVNTPQGHEPSAAPVSDVFPQVGELLSGVQDGPDPARLDVNADEPAPAPEKRFTERASDWIRAAMMGDSPSNSPLPPLMTAPRRSKAKSADAGAEQAELLEQLVPLAALLLVATSSVLIADPYKPVGPNQQEATAMVYPIVKRAVRELDARRKLTEGTTDAIAVLLAVGAYAVRARGTYHEIHAIHAREVERDRSNGRGTSGAAGADIPGFTAQSAVDDSASRARARGGAPVAFATPADGRRGASRGAADGGAGSADERRRNDMLTSLLDADAEGRKRLGIG